MGTDLGLENLLGTSEDDGSPGLRDRLALATRYLANWYRATSSSDNKAIWYQKIDTVRRKVEDSYHELNQPLNLYFLSKQAKVDYDDASASWAALWRELQFSTDTIDVSLIDRVASFEDMLFHAPSTLLPAVGNELGKALGGTLGGFLASTWPYLAAAGGLLAIYIFRAPLARLAGRPV